MPKPRIRKPMPHKLWGRRATDHRALVLEVVATAPYATLRDAVQAEVLQVAAGAASEFHANAISAMVSQLLSEGLLGMKEDRTLFVTQHGLDWLKHGDFTKALPAPHEKPSVQGKKLGPRKKKQ